MICQQISVVSTKQRQKKEGRTMARAISIGRQNYETIRRERYFYIDQTSFIKECWECGFAF